MGAARLGSAIKYIPDPVIVGFPLWHRHYYFRRPMEGLFGLKTCDFGLTFLQSQAGCSLARALPTLHLATIALLEQSALLTLIVGTRYFKRIPAPLVAMLLTTALQVLFHFDGVATLGMAFGAIPRATAP